MRRLFHCILLTQWDNGMAPGSSWSNLFFLEEEKHQLTEGKPTGEERLCEFQQQFDFIIFKFYRNSVVTALVL